MTPWPANGVPGIGAEIMGRNKFGSQASLLAR